MSWKSRPGSGIFYSMQDTSRWMQASRRECINNSDTVITVPLRSARARHDQFSSMHNAIFDTRQYHCSPRSGFNLSEREGERCIAMHREAGQ